MRATIILGILVFSLCSLTAFGKIRENDFGWHLACARYYCEHLRFPNEEPFRYTLDHFEPWKFDWIPELALYGSYLAFGETGVILWRVFLAGVGGLTIWLVSLQRGAKPILAASIVILLWWVIGRFFLDRPSTTVPCLVGLLFLSLYHPTPQRLILTGWIQLLWVNCHGSWPQGLIITVVYAIETWMIRWLRWSVLKKEGGEFAPALTFYLLLILPLTLLNPNGADAWRIFWNILSSPDPWLYNSDGIPPYLWGGRGLWTLLIGCGGIFLLFLASFRKKNLFLSEIILVGGFFWLAIQANRGVFFWALVAAPPLSLALTTLWPAKKRLQYALLGILILLPLSRMIEDVADRMNPPSLWGWGISEELPVKATTFLKEKKFHGNIFCAWDAGGYLSYFLPECKISGDGRFVGTDQWRIYDEIKQGKEGWQNYLPKPGEADIILTNPHDATPWIQVLDEWGVAYWDDFWTLLVRRKSPWGIWLKEKDETLTAFFLVVSLYDFLTPKQREEQFTRINQRIEADPTCSGVWFALGYLLYRQGMEELEKDWPEAKHLWQLSERAFLTSIMLNDRRIQPHYGRVWALLMLGNIEHVETTLSFLLREYPTLRRHAQNEWKRLAPILRNKYAEDHQILEGLNRIERNLPRWCKTADGT